MENPVIIFGANALGRTAKEIFESTEVVVYGFLDDNKKLHNKEIDDVVVLGSTDDDGFLKLFGKKCEAFVAVDDNKLRKGLTKILQEVRHVQPVNATHKTRSCHRVLNWATGIFLIRVLPQVLELRLEAIACFMQRVTWVLSV